MEEAELTEEERRDRLICWFRKIMADVQDLLLDDYLFRALQEIVRTNPNFEGRSGLFTQWMASGYAQAAAVGIRRHAKADHDSISLRRGLEEVKSYPSLISRDHYLELFEGRPEWLVEQATEDFAEIAGTDGTHIKVESVEEHLAELREAVQAIEHYVDRRVAHYDRRGLVQPAPTFGDLTNALNKLEAIFEFYWRFLTGESSELLPHPQFDWQDVFSFPWVPPETHDG